MNVSSLESGSCGVLCAGAAVAKLAAISTTASARGIRDGDMNVTSLVVLRAVVQRGAVIERWRVLFAERRVLLKQPDDVPQRVTAAPEPADGLRDLDHFGPGAHRNAPMSQFA